MMRIVYYDWMFYYSKFYNKKQTNKHSHYIMIGVIEKLSIEYNIKIIHNYLFSFNVRGVKKANLSTS